MKMVIIEPLGVEEGKLLAMAKEALGDRVEIVYYNTKTTDTAELIERGKDAEIIVVSNLPLNAQVIEGCRNLKLLAVAFTGVDHIAMDVCCLLYTSQWQAVPLPFLAMRALHGGICPRALHL